MEINDTLKVVPVKNEAEIKEIAFIHKEIFVDNLSGVSGRQFIESFFKRVMDSPECVIFVCKDDDRIVGFIAGAVSKKGLLDLKLMTQGVLVCICQLFIRPKLLLNIIIQIKGIFLPSKIHVESELLTIGVKEECRKSGAGQKLLNKLEEYFKSKGIRKYKVYSDSKFKDGIRFYENAGFVLKQKLKFFNVSQRLYIKEIKT